MAAWVGTRLVLVDAEEEQIAPAVTSMPRRPSRAEVFPKLSPSW